MNPLTNHYNEVEAFVPLTTQAGFEYEKREESVNYHNEIKSFFNSEADEVHVPIDMPIGCEKK